MGNETYGRSKIRRALHIYIPLKIVNQFLAFCFQIIVVKMLAPNHFATYAVLLGVLMAGERALSFGIDRTIYRFVPALTASGDTAALRGVFSRVFLIRLWSWILFGVLMLFGASQLNQILPVALDDSTFVVFAIWFLAYACLADADAFAQAWVAHSESAFIATLEVLGRITAAGFLLWESEAFSVQAVITICAASSAVAALLLVLRLSWFAARLPETQPRPSQNATFNANRAPMFAMANFASTVAYLISSPPVIRIIAATGLDVIVLASFSFAQGLYISLQRLFPGLLILPTLEPIIMSRITADVASAETYAGLSLVFKIDLMCILTAFIVFCIAGETLFTILSNKEYAKYYFVLPILLMSLILITSYRVFELIANMNFRHDVFFMLWPLSLATTLALYTTVSYWGLASVLFWPILEISLRIGILSYTFRRYDLSKAFDPVRSFGLVLSSAVILVAVMASRWLAHSDLPYQDLYWATFALLAFIGSLFLFPPLRLLEYEIVCMAIPTRLSIIRNTAWNMTWPRKAG